MTPRCIARYCVDLFCLFVTVLTPARWSLGTSNRLDVPSDHRAGITVTLLLYILFDVYVHVRYNGICRWNCWECKTCRSMVDVPLSHTPVAAALLIWRICKHLQQAETKLHYTAEVGIGRLERMWGQHHVQTHLRCPTWEVGKASECESWNVLLCHAIRIWYWPDLTRRSEGCCFLAGSGWTPVVFTESSPGTGCNRVRPEWNRQTGSWIIIDRPGRHVCMDQSTLQATISDTMVYVLQLFKMYQLLSSPVQWDFFAEISVRSPWFFCFS